MGDFKKDKIGFRFQVSGFTIIEFVVYIAVLAILGGSVSALFLWTLQAHTKSRVLQETVSVTKSAMERMVHEIREAESLYLPTTTATQVSLETETSVPVGETTGYIDFFLCGQRLCMKEEENPPVALTPDTLEVTNLSFVAISTNTLFPAVQITLEAQHKNPNNRPELEAVVEFISTATLR